MATAEACFLPHEFHYSGCKWRVLRLCGEGTFSNCFHIRSDISGSDMELKVYKKNSKYHRAFDNELEVYKILKQVLPSNKDSVSFSVKYIDFFTLHDHKCIMMELLGCNLKQLLLKVETNSFSPFLIKKLLHNLVSAVDFLENYSLVHGDIKPSNILWNMNSNCFQLIDFGLSFRTDNSKKECQLIQSPGYRAPEVLAWNKMVLNSSSEFPNIHLDSAIDIWSIGCVVVYASTGQQLYPIEHAQQLPFLCANCRANSGCCTHSKTMEEVLCSIKTTFQSNEFDNLINILSGFLLCHSNHRIRPKDAINDSFFSCNKVAKLGIIDSVLLPTRIVRLMNMFETENEEEKEDMICDIKEECEKLGPVLSFTAKRCDL